MSKRDTETGKFILNGDEKKTEFIRIAPSEKQKVKEFLRKLRKKIA